MVFLTFQVLFVFFFGAKETQASFGEFTKTKQNTAQKTKRMSNTNST
jgi:hypothetical protein